MTSQDEILATFEKLISELENAINRSVKEGSHAFEKKDPEEISRLRDEVNQVGNLKNRIVALKKEWEDLTAARSSESSGHKQLEDIRIFRQRNNSRD